MSADYTLRLDDYERVRFRMMAACAVQHEADLWYRAGVQPGAQVVDLGCGPGAVLVEMAKLVGPSGMAVGVDLDVEAREAAIAALVEEGIDHARLVGADVCQTGLPTGTWDAVMVRHVLIHNGLRMDDLLEHAFELLRPGGGIVVTETDATAFRYEHDPESEILEMEDRYWAMLSSKGNDVMLGPRVSEMAQEAGFEVVERRGRFDVFPLVSNVRPASWAGHDAILAAGFCTQADIDRWEAALKYRERTNAGGWIYVPQFTVLARRPL